MKKVLITGIAGSGGSYLAEHILANKKDVEVHGLSRWHSTTSNDNLANIRDKIHIHECDMNDLSSVIRALEVAQPEMVFHLASHANVRASFDVPLAVVQNNVMSTANLLEGLRILNLKPVLQHCSTSEVYGQVRKEDVPITEECPIRAASPYSVSKVTQDLLCQSYFLSYGLPVVRTRMFAYLNPRRGDLFATTFATQVARIEAGKQDVLLHGNLESTRTIIDVRDAMDAYWVAAEKGKHGEVYNIGGNTVITVGDFLDVLKKEATCEIPSRVDPARLRPTDVTLQVPDTSKFERDTGWTPSIPFEESVSHLLTHCRALVARED